MNSLYLPVPQAFSFDLAVSFLLRSPREVLHRVEDDRVLKALYVEREKVVFSMRFERSQLVVDFLSGPVTEKIKEQVKAFIIEWFDLETDLLPFYAMAAEDKLLGDLVTRFHGYRIVGQPDLFESLIWAVLGQQINLQFAYTLKHRFVEAYGETVKIDDQHYYLFPTSSKVAQLQPEELLPLQFSRQKAAYTVSIAEAFASGHISKEKLKGMPLQQAKEELIKIKGIGNWTANYALMKTFRYPDAFPVEDVGIHNAIKNIKKMKVKPTLDQVKRIFKKYKGWEAYATLYLWKSL